MSARLATAIIEAANRAPGLTMRRGTVRSPTTVEVHDGVLLTVHWWTAAPTTGQPALLLALRGSYVGLPLTTTAVEED